jgi:hypothetical protein
MNKKKRRKLNKKSTIKKRSRSISISSTEIINTNVNKEKVTIIDNNNNDWINVKRKPTPVVQDCHCMNDKKFDLNLISPISTPIHSEDEQEEEPLKRKFYSPFITGLDLDIIPKYSHKEQDIIFTVNTSLFIPKTTNTIQLLENHPFIPSSVNNNNHIHHPHLFGSIGDKRKISSSK